MTQSPSSNPSEPQKASTTWQDWVSRATAVFAVLAALSSGTWGASNLRAILEQGRVNDTWAYYQAASIKAHGAEQMRDLVAALGKGEADDRKQTFSSLASKFDAEAESETSKKQKVYDQAHAYEASRDKMVERGFWFEISFALLQVGVILCTIAGAAKSKGLLVAAIVFALVGLGVLGNGFMFFHHAPPQWYESASKDMSVDVKNAPVAK